MACRDDDYFDARPEWSDVFLAIAKIASVRSHDAQTQHGCVLVRDNRVLGTGFNGFPRDMQDRELPNLRPTKYPFMIHAEVNAVSNCAAKPVGATAYVTGPSCNNCLMTLWNHGVERVVYVDSHGSHDAVYDAEVRETFLQHTGMEILTVDPDWGWIERLFAGEKPVVAKKRSWLRRAFGCIAKFFRLTR